MELSVTAVQDCSNELFASSAILNCERKRVEALHQPLLTLIQLHRIMSEVDFVIGVGQMGRSLDASFSSRAFITRHTSRAAAHVSRSRRPLGPTNHASIRLLLPFSPPMSNCSTCHAFFSGSQRQYPSGTNPPVG